MTQGKFVVNRHPVARQRVSNSPFGIFEVIIMTSGRQFGLLVRLNPSREFNSLDIEGIRENIVEPITQKMPDYVDWYKKHYSREVPHLPEFDMSVPFGCELMTRSIQFSGISIDQKGGDEIRLFIAPCDAQLDHFFLTHPTLN